MGHPVYFPLPILEVVARFHGAKQNLHADTLRQRRLFPVLIKKQNNCRPTAESGPALVPPRCARSARGPHGSPSTLSSCPPPRPLRVPTTGQKMAPIARTRSIPWDRRWRTDARRRRRDARPVANPHRDANVIRREPSSWPKNQLLPTATNGREAAERLPSAARPISALSPPYHALILLNVSRKILNIHSVKNILLLLLFVVVLPRTAPPTTWRESFASSSSTAPSRSSITPQHDTVDRHRRVYPTHERFKNQQATPTFPITERYRATLLTNYKEPD